MQRSSVRSRSGFTLVELLVVIAIIGILVGLLLNGLGRDVPLVQSAMLTQVKVELEHSKGFVIAIPILLALLIHGKMIGEVPIPLRRIDIRTRLGRSRLSLLLGHVVATAPDEWISREDRNFLSNYSQRLDDYILLREDALASPETLLELQSQQMQDYVRVIAILRSGDYVE